MVFVGAVLMCCEMRVGTVAGVTFSIILKAGRRRTEVGSELVWWIDGRGMLEAESISF